MVSLRIGWDIQYKAYRHGKAWGEHREPQGAFPGLMGRRLAAWLRGVQEHIDAQAHPIHRPAPFPCEENAAGWRSGALHLEEDRFPVALHVNIKAVFHAGAGLNPLGQQGGATFGGHLVEHRVGVIGAAFIFKIDASIGMAQ